MKGFDLGELLAAEVSKLDTSAGKDRYELIDIDLLDPDPENFYSMDGLEQLKENILLCGLLQPLRVKLSTEPGRYTVIAGAGRQYAAWWTMGIRSFAWFPVSGTVAARKRFRS